MTSNASSLIRTVDEMLLDAGEPDAAELRSALLALGSLGSLPVPAPGPELAALLAGHTDQMAGHTDQLARHRLLRKRRTAVVGIAVIAGMGLGVTGVAATGTGPNAQASSSVQHLLQDWAPVWSIAGHPAARGSAEGLPDVQLPAEPASPDGPAPAPPQHVEPETVLPGNGPENAGPGRSTEPAGRAGKGAAPGNSTAADGGAPGKAAGVTPGGAPSPDAGTRESRDPAKAATDAAAGLDKAGKLAADTLAEAATAGESVTSAVPQVLTEKTGTGNAGPGSIWLKKFSR